VPRVKVDEFIPLPGPWLDEKHVGMAFLLGVIAGGRIGTLIVPPATAVLDAVSDQPVPEGVIDNIVLRLIKAAGGVWSEESDE
jgi:hypothetical protein